MLCSNVPLVETKKQFVGPVNTEIQVTGCFKAKPSLDNATRTETIYVVNQTKV